MAFIDIPLPNGFFPKLSFIEWHGEFWVLPTNGGEDGGKPTIKHLLQSNGSKIRQPIIPDSNGGIVRLQCYVRYKLTSLFDTTTMTPPQVKEEGNFLFGCEWPYSYSQDQMTFGPYQTFTLPAFPGARILQGSCVDIQSKDQAGATAPWVYAVLQLNLTATAAPYNGWTMQAPVIGGPSYTPQQGPGTPSDTFRMAGFWTEFDLPKPPAPITIRPLLDPNLPLQVMLVYPSENGQVLLPDQRPKLYDWIDKIKSSNLLPSIQNRNLRLQMQSHASKSGNPTYNRTLTDNRIAGVKPIFDTEFGTSIIIITDPRGDKNARSLTGIKRQDYNKALLDDRNVTIFIEEAEAKAALLRDSTGNVTQ